MEHCTYRAGAGWLRFNTLRSVGGVSELLAGIATTTRAREFLRGIHLSCLARGHVKCCVAGRSSGACPRTSATERPVCGGRVVGNRRRCGIWSCGGDTVGCTGQSREAAGGGGRFASGWCFGGGRDRRGRHCRCWGIWPARAPQLFVTPRRSPVHPQQLVAITCIHGRHRFEQLMTSGRVGVKHSCAERAIGVPGRMHGCCKTLVSDVRN